MTRSSPPSFARALLLVGALAIGALSIPGCGSSDSGAGASALTLPPLGSAVTTTAAGASTTTAKAGASTTTAQAGASTTTANAGASTTTAKAGSTTTAAKKAATPDPCTVLSKAQAEALAGTALVAGITAGAPGDQSCTYAGAPNGPTAQVELFVGDGAKGYYDVDKTLDHAFTPIPNLGDEAYLEDYNVFARKGSVWVALRLTRTTDFAPYRQPMIDLTTTILKSL